MSKQNKIIWRALVVLVIAFLISLCFLGSTFARYTSTASGTGGVQVAKWSVTGEAEFVADAQAYITPYLKEYEGTSGYDLQYARSNTSGMLYSLQITNNSNVQVAISDLAVDENEISYWSDANTEITSFGYNDADDSDDADYLADKVVNNGYNYNQYISKDNISKMISVALYIQLTDTEIQSAYPSEYITVEASCKTFTNDSNYYLSVDSTYATSFTTMAASQSGGNTLDIYAQVTWTSDISSTIYGECADFIDTWIGKKVQYIKFGVTCKAVQASQHTDGEVKTADDLN